MLLYCTAGKEDAHDRQGPAERCDDRRAARPSGRAAVHLGLGLRAARPRRILPSDPSARRGRLRALDGGGGRDRHNLRPVQAPGDCLRHRHLARRPRGGAARRHLHRPLADERGHRSQLRRHRLPRAGRRHAQAAQRISARYRTVLPDRSGCGRLIGRHGGDARLGHQCGALWHHARQRAGPDRGAPPTGG